MRGRERETSKKDQAIAMADSIASTKPLSPFNTPSNHENMMGAADSELVTNAWFQLSSVQSLRFKRSVLFSGYLITRIGVQTL